MSRDQFAVVLNHPHGGYCLAIGQGSKAFVNTGNLDTNRSFPTVKELLAYWDGYYFGGGISISPEVDESLEYAEEQLKFWAKRVQELGVAKVKASYEGIEVVRDLPTGDNRLTTSTVEEFFDEYFESTPVREEPARIVDAEILKEEVKKFERSFFTGNLERQP